MSQRLLVPSLTNRTGFNQDDLKAMAETMKVFNVRQPLIVRALPGARLQETRLNTPKGQPLPTHESVCGERRWLASQLAGLPDVPVLIRVLTDEQALEEQVIENVQRENFTALEEGEAFQRLMQQNKLTAEEVAAKVGKSRRHVFNRTKLLDLRSETRAALQSGEIDATRALLLAGIPDHQQQLKALAALSEKDFAGDHQLSLRAATAYIQREFMLNLSGAKFKITDATLVPDAGSCKTCPKRTGHDPDLFADVKGADICTDPPCFHRKEEAHNNRVLQLADDNGQTVITGREAKALMPNSWGGIEGYLRLDDAKDSPTGKPLRKLIGNQLDKEEVKPTLIENPHKKGDMIAVLPASQVAELLKSRGHKNAAATIDADSKEAEKAKADEEKARLSIKYEQSWRDQLLQRTWAAIVQANFGGGTSMTDGVLRYLARHIANTANAERCRQLCKLLDLGKVAPKDALLDHIKTCAQPEHIVLLLIMHQDTEYRHWSGDPLKGNEGLMLVAADFQVDVEEVKAVAKKTMRVQISTKTVPAADPSLPELRSKGGAGGQTKNRTGSAAPAPARKQKISADEATLGIAVAMQGLRGGQSDASGIDPQATAPIATASDPAALAANKGEKVDAWPFPGTFAQDEAAGSPASPKLAIGVLVTVCGPMVLRPAMARFAGKPGKITGEDGCDWIVELDGRKGRNGGIRTFTPREIEAVQA
ncbi:MAG: ParB/RepB/Spo0J family partition protein [Burkholderiales bacterium]